MRAVQDREMANWRRPVESQRTRKDGAQAGAVTINNCSVLKMTIRAA